MCGLPLLLSLGEGGLSSPTFGIEENKAANKSRDRDGTRGRQQGIRWIEQLPLEQLASRGVYVRRLVKVSVSRISRG